MSKNLVNYSLYTYIYIYIYTYIYIYIYITEVGRRLFMTLCCSITSMFFVLVVYTKVVMESNTMSDRIKAFLDDFQWPEHMKDHQLKQIRRRMSSMLMVNRDFV
jgi:hypothetical protein